MIRQTLRPPRVPMAAVLIATATLTGAGAAQPSPAVDLRACAIPGVEGPTRCGTVSVPENRRVPGGRTIALNVVVLDPLSAEPRADPLFTFAGGPGQAESEDARSNADRFAAIRQHRAIVMIDQRGTGRSNPLACTAGDADAIIQAYLVGMIPRAALDGCRARLAASADPAQYTTDAAVDDAEAVRRALGYERINLYGGSYGSRPVLVYLRRFPHRVRTATVRSVYPMHFRNPLWAARDAQGSFDRLAADCAATPACHAEFPDVRGDLAGAMTRFDEHPVRLRIADPRTRDSVDVSVDGAVVGGVVRRLLYQSASQSMIPLLLADVRRGDARPLAPVLSQVLMTERVLSLGLFLSVTCAEDVRHYTGREARERAAGTFVGPTLALGLKSACRGWPAARVTRTFQRAVSSTVPTLILSGELDPITPQRWGAETARTLGAGRHVVLGGVAHGPFPACAIAGMARLIETGSVPAGTICPPVPRPPFRTRSGTAPGA